jgi:hypothetical protein
MRLRFVVFVQERDGHVACTSHTLRHKKIAANNEIHNGLACERNPRISAFAATHHNHTPCLDLGSE